MTASPITTIPTTMRAMLLTGYGGYDQLQLRSDVSVPAPAEGEVLIQVGACGVNNTDIWTREGAYGANEQSGWKGGSFTFPRIQGADIVGTVVGLGVGVPATAMGQRVMVNPTLYGGMGEGLFDAQYLGSERDGGFAEYVCVPHQNAHSIVSALSDAALATFMLSHLTAEHMLNRAGVTGRDTVLVTGASGGVGSALVQLARVRGARVVAIIGKGKEAHLADLDVNGVIWRGATDLPGALESQIGCRSVDVVADIVGGEQVAQLLDVLCVGGRYVAAGAIAGPMVTVDWRKLYLKHLTVLGSTMGTKAESLKIVEHVAVGKIKPLLAATYPLENLVQAQIDFKSKGHFGKLVVIP